MDGCEKTGYSLEKTNGKWHVYDSEGKDWCAFDSKDRAEELLKVYLNEKRGM